MYHLGDRVMSLKGKPVGEKTMQIHFPAVLARKSEPKWNGLSHKSIIYGNFIIQLSDFLTFYVQVTLVHISYFLFSSYKMDFIFLLLYKWDYISWMAIRYIILCKNPYLWEVVQQLKNSTYWPCKDLRFKLLPPKTYSSQMSAMPVLEDMTTSIGLLK